MHWTAEVEDRLEDGMVGIQIHPRTIRQHLRDLTGEAFPFLRAPKIVDEECSAAGQVFADISAPRLKAASQ